MTDENRKNMKQLRLLIAAAMSIAALGACGAKKTSENGEVVISDGAATPSGSAIVKRGDLESVMSVWFAAPPSLVFDAMTSPDQLRDWLAPGDMKLVGCDIDLRPGGEFRYTFKSDSGSAFAMFGEYREVERPSRIVHLESYEGSDWPPLVVTTKYAGANNGTVLTATILYPSMEIRDQDFPNLQHAIATYVRLAGFLARQQSLDNEKGL